MKGTFVDLFLDFTVKGIPFFDVKIIYMGSKMRVSRKMATSYIPSFWSGDGLKRLNKSLSMLALGKEVEI